MDEKLSFIEVLYLLAYVSFGLAWVIPHLLQEVNVKKEDVEQPIVFAQQGYIFGLLGIWFAYIFINGG